MNLINAYKAIKKINAFPENPEKGKYFVTENNNLYVYDGNFWLSVNIKL